MQNKKKTIEKYKLLIMVIFTYKVIINITTLVTKRLKNVRFTKYRSISLLAFVIALFNIFLYQNNKRYEDKFIKSYLFKQLTFIHHLLNKDINNILEEKEPEYLLIIKNYLPETSTIVNYEGGIISKIYNNNGNNIIVDFVNVLELISELAKNNFYYCIKLNGKKLNEIPLDITANYAIEFNNKILDNDLSIIVNLKDDAWIKVESNQRIIEKLLYIIIISLVIFIFLSYFILVHYSDMKVISLLNNDINSLRQYFQYEKNYIKECYEYSKQDQDLLERLNSAGLINNCSINDYLPLYLTPVIEKKIYYLDVITIDFSNLIKGYNIINHSNIKIVITNKTTNNVIITNLENQILLQLICSIMRNFMQFKIHTNEEANIKVVYFNNSIKFEIDSLRLTKTHLIKWSKNIFDSTSNPFILNFEQIFNILEIFDNESEVNYNDNYLVLTLKFKSEFEEQDTYPSNIININIRNK